MSILHRQIESSVANVEATLKIIDDHPELIHDVDYETGTPLQLLINSSNPRILTINPNSYEDVIGSTLISKGADYSFRLSNSQRPSVLHYTLTSGYYKIALTILSKQIFSSSDIFPIIKNFVTTLLAIHPESAGKLVTSLTEIIAKVLDNLSLDEKLNLFKNLSQLRSLSSDINDIESSKEELLNTYLEKIEDTYRDIKDELNYERLHDKFFQYFRVANKELHGTVESKDGTQLPFPELVLKKIGNYMTYNHFLDRQEEESQVTENSKENSKAKLMGSNSTEFDDITN